MELGTGNGYLVIFTLRARKNTLNEYMMSMQDRPIYTPSSEEISRRRISSLPFMQILDSPSNRTSLNKEINEILVCDKPHIAYTTNFILELSMKLGFSMLQVCFEVHKPL